MENYPIYEILRRYKPVYRLAEEYGIPESRILELIDSGKLEYTLFKEPGKFKRIPHVDESKLKELVGAKIE